jgi:CRP-like cAMP-binding protein
MSIAEELKGFSLFRNVELADLESLAKFMKPRTVAAGEILFRQGEPGDAMFLIRSGQIRIFIEDEKDGERSEVTLRQYGAGQLVGEFSLLDDKPRSASAAGAERSEVMVLERADFLAFLRQRPVLGVAMMVSLAERVRYTTQYLEKLNRAINLLSENHYEEALREIETSGDEGEVQQLIASFLQMIQTLRKRKAADIRATDGTLRKVAAKAKVELDSP